MQVVTRRITVTPHSTSRVILLLVHNVLLTLPKCHGYTCWFDKPIPTDRRAVLCISDNNLYGYIKAECWIRELKHSLQPIVVILCDVDTSCVFPICQTCQGTSIWCMTAIDAGQRRDISPCFYISNCNKENKQHMVEQMEGWNNPRVPYAFFYISCLLNHSWSGYKRGIMAQNSKFVLSWEI